MEIESVIGLDPGSNESAFVHWNGKAILDKGVDNNEVLLKSLETMCAFSINGPILVVESMVHIEEGGKEIVDAIFWAGRFYQVWYGQREKMPRYKVTLALTGQMPSKRADKITRHVLITRFGAPGKKANPGFTYGLVGTHLWAAFALAVVYWDNLQFHNRIQK